MERQISVREFDILIGNSDYADNPYYTVIPEKQFEELQLFVTEYSSDEEESDIHEFLKVGHKKGVGYTISLNNYVGLIELPSGFQIEVLPKIEFTTDDEEDRTRSVFLRMLRSLKEFEGKAFSSASLKSDKMNLYEIFINMYIQETNILIKHGLKSTYVANEDNLNFYKGKLQISRHIRMNLAHKEKFYVQYDEYSMNRAENKLVKATLLKLLSESKNEENKKNIRRLLPAFELVDESLNYDYDFSKVSIDRNSKDYTRLMDWSKIFLYNKSFTTFAGESIGRALLFPMEKVFEAYVAKWVKRVFGEAGYYVTAQDSGYYLFDEPHRKFRLRPDIVVRKNGTTIIMDTKWKRLNKNPNQNYGISQADMYQMYAYAKKYSEEMIDEESVPEVWLLYPYYDEVKDFEIDPFISDDGVKVHVYFVNVDKIEESVEQLRSLVGEYI